MSNASNVTVGKPKVVGGVYRAPAGTTLPTTAKTDLADAFENMGYISEDGLTNSGSVETGNIKAWGGDIVHVYESEKTDTFAYTMIEATNVQVLKNVFGDDNVSGTLDSGIVIKANAKEHEESVYVFDLVLGDCLKRIVVPKGKLTTIGDTVYTDNDAVSYPVTITCLPDGEGNTHYEYIAKAAS